MTADGTPAVDMAEITAQVESYDPTNDPYGYGYSTRIRPAFEALLGMVDTLTAERDRANYMLVDAQRQIEAAIADRDSFRAAASEWDRQRDTLTAALRDLYKATAARRAHPRRSEHGGARCQLCDALTGAVVKAEVKARAALAGTSPTPNEPAAKLEVQDEAATNVGTRDLAALADQWDRDAEDTCPTSSDTNPTEAIPTGAAVLRRCARNLRAVLEGAVVKPDADPLPKAEAKESGLSHGGAPTTEPERCWALRFLPKENPPPGPPDPPASCVLPGGHKGDHVGVTGKRFKDARDPDTTGGDDG